MVIIERKGMDMDIPRTISFPGALRPTIIKPTNTNLVQNELCNRNKWVIKIFWSGSSR